MDYETLQALIEVYRGRASTDLLAIVLDEAEGPEGRKAILDLLRSLPPGMLFDDDFAPVRRKACQFCLNAFDFELAEKLTRGSEQPEDRAMRARALHGLGRDEEAISLYRQAIAQDPAMRNRELERILGIRPASTLAFPPAKIISLTSYTSRRDIKATPERRDPIPESFLEDLDASAFTFADVAGLDAIKEEIRRRIVLPYLKPSVFERYRQKAGGNLLLYGPPGCGKTLIARATAGESDARFLSVSAEEVLDKHAGEAEKRLRVFFDEARSDPPAILFFDDFELLASSRSSANSELCSGLVSVLRSELDGTLRSNSGILVIAATSEPWHIDPAILRPGRFQKVIFVPPPPAEARKKIIAAAIAKVPGHDKVLLDRLARKSAGFSGGDLRALCDWVNNAALTKALAEGPAAALLTGELFEQGLRAFNPSTSEWLALARAKMKPLTRNVALASHFSELVRR